MLFTLTFMLILTASALTFYNSKLSLAQAQTSNPTFHLTINGLVENPLNLTLDDIRSMPQTTEEAALYCVADPRTPLEQGVWKGVELSYLLQQANVSQNALKVAFFASDGFSTDLAIQTAMQNHDILVAYQKYDQSLGGLKLVVPFHWGYKWISSLTQIQLVEYNFVGTYEGNGYSDDGTVTVSGPVPVPLSQESSYPTPIPTVPTQETKPTTTSEPPSLTSIIPTASPAASTPEPQSASASPFILYVTALSTITVTSTLASIAILIKRKKTKI